MAEYIVAPASTLRRVPTGVSASAAAGVGVAAATAYQAMNGLAISPGTKLLILGGSSAIGLFATAMAKDKGCSRITVTSTNDALCRSFGATEVINYKTTDWLAALKGQDFDCVLDTVEGVKGWRGSLRSWCTGLTTIDLTPLSNIMAAGHFGLRWYHCANGVLNDSDGHSDGYTLT